ncbi:MAG: SpoIIE family protein phosphatase [Planctomycetaceae bacterium]|jgi:sigma-B regulation protein RsbU (phosphoserine phosphatase)|nr:SpoIIE family protein phosphatase [Planctomycetaceae bacterium]
MPFRFPYPSSIRSKIIAVTIGVVVMLGIALLLLSRGIYTEYKMLQIARVDSLVKFSGGKIDERLIEIENGVCHLAYAGGLCEQTKHLSDKDMPKPLRHIAKESLLRYLQTDGTAVGGGIWFEPFRLHQDKERNCVYAFRRGEQFITDEDSNSQEYDYLSRNWYVSIKKQMPAADQVVWTEPYYDGIGTRALMTTAGAAVYDAQGGFAGVATLDWELASIVQSISRIKPTDNSMILFADRSHNFVLGIHTPDNDTVQSAVGKTLDSIPWYSPALCNKDELTYNGKKQIVFVKILHNGMIIFVLVPREELFAEINSHLLHTVLALVSACGSVSFFVYAMLNQLINKPVVELSRQASQIGNGHLDVPIRVNSHSELGVLASALNKMQTDIKEFIRNLNQVNAEKERISVELDIARRIQAAMLPSIKSLFQGRNELETFFEIDAAMTPAREVAGDYYDFFMLDGSHLAVVIADVSGKGVPAALFLTICKTLIKNYAGLGLEPEEIFNAVNEGFCESNTFNMFATAFAGILDISTGKLTFVNAGHNPPFIKLAAEQQPQCNSPDADTRFDSAARFEKMKLSPGLVLGAMQGVQYQQETITLPENSCLFLYTDGITEAMNSKSELFTEHRLAESLNSTGHTDGGSRSATDLLNRVKQDIERFVDGAEQSDDITMLALRYRPSTELIWEQTFAADVKMLPEVNAFITQCLEKLKYPPGEIMKMQLVCEEICVNIAHYAYNDADNDTNTDTELSPERCPMTVRITGTEGQDTEIQFRDSGRPFNPLLAAAPDITLSSQERPLGGLGLLLIKKNVDIILYDYTGKQNILTLTKTLPK